MSLGISVAMATILLAFHAQQAWTVPFKFEMSWMFDGADIISPINSYTVYTYDKGDSVSPVQISHNYGPSEWTIWTYTFAGMEMLCLRYLHKFVHYCHWQITSCLASWSRYSWSTLSKASMKSFLRP